MNTVCALVLSASAATAPLEASLGHCPATHGTSLHLLLLVAISSFCLQSGKPFLGICLGLQLLFEGSTESGGVEGLGVVPGSVSEFDRLKGLPVPHIGWNSLQERQAFTLL